MVKTMPHRQISSTEVRIGASKKNNDTKDPIGHNKSDKTINQKIIS